MITEKILIVDDEDAVKKINDNNFDLVITDLMMPKTNGLELLQIIRDHYPELEVIMITGYASIDTQFKPQSWAQ